MLFLKGYINLQKQDYYIASIFLTKSIEHGRIYSPTIRKRALVLLKEMFNKIPNNNNHKRHRNNNNNNDNEYEDEVLVNDGNNHSNNSSNDEDDDLD